MSYFEHVKALLIVGPTGCGKTTKAKEIADREPGTVSYTTANRCFGNHFDVDLDADTVVVDECSSLQPWMKSLAFSEKIAINKRGEPVKLRPTPNFIFCIQDTEPFRFEHADRRFLVIRP